MIVLDQDVKLRNVTVEIEDNDVPLSRVNKDGKLEIFLEQGGTSITLVFSKESAYEIYQKLGDWLYYTNGG